MRKIPLISLLFCCVPFASAQLTITTTTCPSGTQLTVYAGCTMVATGGTTPYTWSFVTTSGTTTIPEGLTLHASTGVIDGTVTGQGVYDATTIKVTDAASATATKQITFSISGDNTFGGTDPFWPSDSFFHGQNIASLPVDTSPAAVPLPGNIHLVFGADIIGDGGFPINTVLSTQSNIGVSCPNGSAGCFQSYFTSAPYFAGAAIESTQNNSNASTYIGDGHSPLVQLAGGGNHAQLWESFGSQLVSGPAWQDISNAYWDMGTYAMLPDDNGSTDAAGLPVAPFLANYDDVMATGGMKRPIRFTISGSHTLQYHVWPATAQSGGGLCVGGYHDPTTGGLISQGGFLGLPPTACQFVTPTGNITSGSNQLTNLSSTSLIVPGSTLRGTGIPNPDVTTVLSISGTTITMSANATATASGVSLLIGIPGQNNDRIVFGEIYRVKAASCATPPDARLTNFSTNPQAASVFRTMCNYGIILADNGIGIGLSGTADARWDDSDLAALTTVLGSDMEPVNVSSLITAYDSSQIVGSSPTSSAIFSGNTKFSGNVVLP